MVSACRVEGARVLSSPVGLAPRIFEEYIGDGIYLYIKGKRYVDCASGTFNLSLGYSAREVIDALHQQLDRCCHLSRITPKEKSAEIFETLREFLPNHLRAFWFRDIIGSTANECAIRIAQGYRQEGHRILFMSHHGQSLVATGVSGNAFRQQASPPRSPEHQDSGAGLSRLFLQPAAASCGLLCAKRLEGLRRIWIERSGWRRY